MGMYVINGGHRLEGELKIEGSKNAVLPILAASIINGRESIIHNVPYLKDVNTLLGVLETIGCTCSFQGNTVIVNSRGDLDINIPDKPVREMRSSIILMGAMLARFKKINITFPGGCEIGLRPIDLHLSGLRRLGAKVVESHGYIQCECDKLYGNEIHLDYPSVGATENIMLAAISAEGVTTIQNAARESEIVDLQNFLNKMGAKITGGGSSTIRIEGVNQFHDVEHTVIPDRIVTGTYAVAAAITGGKVILRDIIHEHIKPIISKLEESGCEIYRYDKDISISCNKRPNAVDIIKTMPYPGFPTDMQAQMMALMCTAKGTSVFIENIFENRYKHAEELIKMGANIKIEGRAAIVKGVTKLTGAHVYSRDLRGGAALVLAGLAAEGTTIVDNVDVHIERGYENLDKKLNSLGADITKEK
ncbi:UDP-N-acetylglucosamine 1-carboxyvinyltransferase [Lutispora thermophila]|uniref:UDP-N-acetylglucosamine 1-carboxyvinyltransferase n=1 Tax=Lutispora thermophila DSM 19022 TaxID=1122184 RepID=A0A1M6CMY0_9FIRM|nr:UDP-N-acetylglucosamine 1-carboxyvinyltransferase [Lutispora thermophila]SHI62395.1 UDP-N-acetylglucosamine 1-carboxyvinyltransferase [Lutispora thermophila DSM 19022]